MDLGVWGCGGVWGWGGGSDQIFSAAYSNYFLENCSKLYSYHYEMAQDMQINIIGDGLG